MPQHPPTPAKRAPRSRVHRLLLMGLGAAALLVSGVAVGFIVLLSGVMSTAATKQHFRLTYWILERGLDYSVRTHSKDIAVPALDRPGLLEQGFVCYRAHCAQCHGAPGISPEDLAKGQLPLANNLAYTGRTWHPAELYWVTKTGIRMSGMPAWEFRVSEEALWSLVAFVKHLPSLDVPAYAQFEQRQLPPSCPRPAPQAGGPDAERGKVVLGQYACTTCHIIPGVIGPEVYVGPPLTAMARRGYLSGSLPNTPGNLVRWIRDPQSIDPATLMPDLDVTEAHARDMAAYLATLR
jgi:mono/diheme cytochrome c family protein/cytochrome c2